MGPWEWPTFLQTRMAGCVFIVLELTGTILSFSKFQRRRVNSFPRVPLAGHKWVSSDLIQGGSFSITCRSTNTHMPLRRWKFPKLVENGIERKGLIKKSPSFLCNMSRLLAVAIIRTKQDSQNKRSPSPLSSLCEASQTGCSGRGTLRAHLIGILGIVKCKVSSHLGNYSICLSVVMSKD